MKALFTQFNHLSNLIQRIFSKEFHQMPLGQGKILQILHKHGSLSQKELTECMQIRPASMSELLSKLEEKGYISKKPHDTDKRIFDIFLTKNGNSEAKKLQESQDKMHGEIFSCLSGAEQEQLSELICKIINALEDNDSQPFEFCVRCNICTQSYMRRE